MPKIREIYKCEKCGNIVEVLHGGGAELVCCGEEMTLLEGNTVDAAKEKHVPVIESADGKCTVRIGSAPHPMEEKHHIELIELLTEDRIYRAHLDAGDKPEAVFTVEGQVLGAREYCNVHGLWKTA